MSLSKYFQILNCSYGSTIEEIKKQYRKLVLKYHPDKNNSSEFSTRKMAELNTAYEEILRSKNIPKIDQVTCNNIMYIWYILYMYVTYILSKPATIYINIDVELSDIYNSVIKKICYKVWLNNELKKSNIFMQLDTDLEYIYDNVGDENIFTKARGDVVIKCTIINTLYPHIRINDIIDKNELTYTLEVNLYEYFYGFERLIDIFGNTEIVYFEPKCLSKILKQKGFMYEDKKKRGDVIILCDVDINKNNFTKYYDKIALKTCISELFHVV